MNPTRSLFLVSPDDAFQARLARTLSRGSGEIRLCGTCTYGNGALPASMSAALREGAAVLIDMDSDPEASLHTLREIVRRAPGAAVVAATARDESRTLLGFIRAGAADVVQVPVETGTLSEVLGRLRPKAAPETTTPPARQGRILSFLSTKGGCGATTVGVNLAVALCRRMPEGKEPSVLLVDMDAPGGDVCGMLRIEPTYSLADVAENLHRLDMSLLESMTARHESGLRVLASAAEGAKPGTVSAETMVTLLSFLREHFETVILAGGRPTGWTASTLGQAQIVHLVTTIDFLALRRAQAVLRTLADQGITGEMVRIVVNRAARTTDLTLADVRKALDRPIAWSIPRDHATVEAAVNEGVPLVERGRSRIREAFMNYAGEIAGSKDRRAPGRLIRWLMPRRAGATT